MKTRTKDPIWIYGPQAAKMIDPNWDESKLKEFLKSRGIVPYNTDLESVMEYQDIIRIPSRLLWKDVEFFHSYVTDHTIDLIKEILQTEKTIIVHTAEEAEEFYNDQYEYYKSIGQID